MKLILRLKFLRSTFCSTLCEITCTMANPSHDGVRAIPLFRYFNIWSAYRRTSQWYASTIGKIMRGSTPQLVRSENLAWRTLS